MASRRTVGLLTCALAFVIGGCSDPRSAPVTAGPTTTSTRPAATTASSAAHRPPPAPSAEPQAPPEESTAARPQGDRQPDVTARPSEDQGPAPQSAGHGYCLDINSEVVAHAVATLGTAPGGDPWQPQAGTEATTGHCPALLWMTAQTPRGTASSPEHVLFFHDNTYLGTAAAKPTAFTSVTGSTDTSVTVQYRWIAGDEPNCCPAGGPVTVTYTWNGTAVVPDRELPPEVTG
ncbi:LppP/LprE family lipoprotein [Nocardia veterana]|uniref:LppP/LprE family lipoprotein n=2 Tax=Nocardia veterana TaxID=132249 RepID=A0A7X6M5E3_9NOCA|nr:LppP/LprE family lipoprotein [Nocardia veterana]NKY89517.1 LppP/LprE family lipoprotein [Nocardia veterana]